MFSKVIIILYIVMTTHDMNIHSLNQQATIATYYKHSDHLSNRYSILLPNGQIPKYMSISFLSVQLLKQLSFFDALIKGLRIKAVVLPVLADRPAISGSEGQRLHFKANIWRHLLPTAFTSYKIKRTIVPLMTPTYDTEHYAIM